MTPGIAQLAFRVEELILLALILPAAIAGIFYGVRGNQGYGKLAGVALIVVFIVTGVSRFGPPTGLIAETTLIAYSFLFFFGATYTFRPSLRLLGLGLVVGSVIGVFTAFAVML